MSKRFELALDEYQAAIYKSAIRSKRDVLLVWMESIKNYLVDQPPSVDRTAAHLIIEIDSMSRIFCTLDGGKKIFSLSFPFAATLSDGQYQFRSREGIEIDSRVSSNVISLVESGEIFGTQDFSRFIDPILEMSEYDPQLWSLVRELMVAEDGYIRYDWDETRQDGHRHPLHHLDVCYSNACGFKVGLNGQLDQPAFVAILDAATDCHYLAPATGR